MPHALTTQQWEQHVIYDPPYSPDLSPPDYFAFQKLKMELEGDQYATIRDIQTSVMTKLKTIPITDFLRAMHQLEDHANQCTAVNGNYFEYKKNLFRIFWWFSKHSFKTYKMHCVLSFFLGVFTYKIIHVPQFRYPNFSKSIHNFSKVVLNFIFQFS